MRTGSARNYVGNFHEAGFYSSDEQFLALILPFVTGGLAAREPVVIGYDTRKSQLLRAALPPSAPVHYIVDSSLYASPARAIEAYRRQFDQLLATGAGQVRIAGDVPHEGNGGRFEGWDRYESAVNIVWHDYPVWSRCLYDATTTPDTVRDVVERTHPRLVTADGHADPSRRYQQVNDFQRLPVATDPLQPSPPALALTDPAPEQVRRELTRVAYGRIDTTALDDLLFAVTEAVLNAEAFGREPWTVRAWVGADRLVVDVHDTGPGPADPLTGLVRATAGASGTGLGLWLCHQLDGVDIALISDEDGFTVRLRAGRPPGAADSAADRLSFPVGTVGDDAGPRRTLHAIDGDGTSLCGQYGRADLTRIDRLRWPVVPTEARCPHCGTILAFYGQ